MSSDGYAVIRGSTLAWLLERVRQDGELRDVPEEVARDLKEAIVPDAGVKPPVSADRLRALGPVLSADEHEQLLLEDEELNLPRDKNAGQFWRVVVGVCHEMMCNEAEAVLRIVGASEGGKDGK